MIDECGDCDGCHVRARMRAAGLCGEYEPNAGLFCTRLEGHGLVHSAVLADGRRYVFESQPEAA